jgi:hypothetical protein
MRIASGGRRCDRRVLRVRSIHERGCAVLVSGRHVLLMTMVRRLGCRWYRRVGSDTDRLAHGSRCRSCAQQDHQRKRRHSRQPVHRSSISWPRPIARATARMRWLTQVPHTDGLLSGGDLHSQTKSRPNFSASARAVAASPEAPGTTEGFTEVIATMQLSH